MYLSRISFPKNTDVRTRMVSMGYHRGFVCGLLKRTKVAWDLGIPSSCVNSISP